MPNNPFSLGDFRDACNNHDGCYDTCLTYKTGCDLIFCTELVLVCKKDPDPVRSAACLLFAGLYCATVNMYGDSAYDEAQKQACSCCNNN